MLLFLASSQHSFLPTFIKTSEPGFQYSDMLMPPKNFQISRQEMELKNKKQKRRRETKSLRFKKQLYLTIKASLIQCL